MIFGELEAGQKALLLEHLAECEKCKALLADMRSVRGALKEALEAGEPPRLSPARRAALLEAVAAERKKTSQKTQPAEPVTPKSVFPTLSRPLSPRTMGAIAAVLILAVVAKVFMPPLFKGRQCLNNRRSIALRREPSPSGPHSWAFERPPPATGEPARPDAGEEMPAAENEHADTRYGAGTLGKRPEVGDIILETKDFPGNFQKLRDRVGTSGDEAVPGPDVGGEWEDWADADKTGKNTYTPEELVGFIKNTIAPETWDDDKARDTGGGKPGIDGEHKSLRLLAAKKSLPRTEKRAELLYNDAHLWKSKAAPDQDDAPSPGIGTLSLGGLAPIAEKPAPDASSFRQSTGVLSGRMGEPGFQTSLALKRANGRRGETGGPSPDGASAPGSAPRGHELSAPRRTETEGEKGKDAVHYRSLSRWKREDKDESTRADKKRLKNVKKREEAEKLKEAQQPADRLKLLASQPAGGGGDATYYNGRPRGAPNGKPARPVGGAEAEKGAKKTGGFFGFLKRGQASAPCSPALDSKRKSLEGILDMGFLVEDPHGRAPDARIDPAGIPGIAVPNRRARDAQEALKNRIADIVRETDKAAEEDRRGAGGRHPSFIRLPAEEAREKEDGRELAETSAVGYKDMPEATPEVLVEEPVPNGEPESVAIFKEWPVNPFVMTKQDRLSTFSLDVDTASYALARNYIRRGYLPPAASVRMEEFINAFDYNYPKHTGSVFTVHAEGMPSPFGRGLTLLKIGVQGRALGREGRKPAHLVFVVDASGSMARADRLPLVQYGLTLLAGQLTSGDRVSMITFGSRAALVLEAVPAGDERISAAIRAIGCGGSTNLLQGIELGYGIARRAFRTGQINRVILCSDGAANIGITDGETMLEKVQVFRDHGITFSSIGFGMGAYNDELLEKLADEGDGSYAFVGSRAEARRVFVEQMATLQTIAGDAKIQVEFDPAHVRRYRLIGYENRDIADKDFRNDAVDAGEVGSGQSSTALYEVEPLDRTGDLGTVYVRYRNIDTGKIEEISRRLERSIIGRPTPRTAPRLYLAAAGAEFAEILRESEHAAGGELDSVRNILIEVAAALPLDQRVRELLGLVTAAKGLPRAQ